MRAVHLGALLVAVYALAAPVERAQARTIEELAEKAPIKLFVATKGVEMPNTTDQTNNLQEGDKALLLSSLELTDLKGIGKLSVDDGGKIVPVAEVKDLHIFLNHNQIKAIPEEFATMDRVKFLYFEHNQLHDLPKALADMESLEGMYFTDNQFTAIPSFVLEMRRLKKLQFSRNKIHDLPATIGNLTELRHLNLSDNQIETVPESISRLTRLRVCDLSDNRIASLPEAFGKVQIVNQLRVRNNPLTSLPIGFATMRATIDVTGTQIDVDKLPPDLKAKISTEKPPGSKEPEKQVVKESSKKRESSRPER